MKTKSPLKTADSSISSGEELLFQKDDCHSGFEYQMTDNDMKVQ